MDIDRLKCVYGDYIEFKGVKLHPILMENYNKFENSIGILAINKNVSPNPQIISMGYLDFIIGLSASKPQINTQIETILQLVFKEQYYQYKYDNKLGGRLEIYPNIYMYGQIKPTIIDSYDFDDMRRIILKQNLVPFDDSIVDAEILKLLEENLEYINKHNSGADIDEMVTLYCCLSGKNEEEVKSKTIYQFKKSLNRYIHIEQCRTMNLLNANDRLKENTKIPSITDHIPEKGKYDDVMVSEKNYNQLTSDAEVN